MNSPNHILIGTLIYEYLRDKYGIVLDKPGFLQGNTCPDHSLSFLRPHRMRYCKGMVRRKTERLCRADWSEIDRRTSKKLGILCHYYSDFLCLAHNPEFNGGLKEHVRYENDLLLFMSRNYDRFRRVDYVPWVQVPENPEEISEHMRELFFEKPTAQDDLIGELVYAVRACIELALLVFFQSVSGTQGQVLHKKSFIAL